MHGSRSFAVAVVSTAALAFMAACGSDSGSSGAAKSDGGGAPIEIGAYAPLTGDRAASGTTEANGVKLAVKQINAQGGINGRQLKLDYKDDTGDANKSTTTATELATQTKVVAVIGTYGSDLGLPSSAAFEKSQVPNIQPFISAAEATKRGFKYIFNTYSAATALDDATFHAGIRAGLYKPTRVAQLYIDSPYAIETAQYVNDQASKEGYQVVADEKVQMAQPSYSSVLTKLKSANPDMVFLNTSPGEMKVLLTEMKQLNFKPKWLYSEGNNALEPTVLEAVGDLTENIIHGTHWFPAAPYTGNSDFVAAYNKEYGQDPSIASAGGYQAVQVLAAALKTIKGDITRQSVRDALSKVKADTVEGPVSFDANGQGTFNSFLVQTQNGKPVVLLPENQKPAGTEVKTYGG
jgi:ABC-type branched-subunit amino acid transport system substrate-binding protein